MVDTNEKAQRKKHDAWQRSFREVHDPDNNDEALEQYRLSRALSHAVVSTPQFRSQWQNHGQPDIYHSRATFRQLQLERNFDVDEFM